MAFNREEVSKLLFDCKRRCCVCLKFCGVNIEIHHINQHAYGGTDSIDNGIPLCFECHAEVNHYNDRHPRGRKYTPEELKLHRDNWLKVCEEHPETLVSAPKRQDIGPLESMLMELEYNSKTLDIPETGRASMRIPGQLKEKAYEKAVNEGFLNLLDDVTREVIMRAYMAIAKVNNNITSFATVVPEGNAYAESVNRVLEAIREERSKVYEGYKSLKVFLKPEEDTTNT